MPLPVDAILKLRLPLIVRLAQKSLRVEDVTALMPGTIIELDKDADEELELLVNNKPIGAGNAVKVGENFGIRLSFVGDLRERVEAMGSGTQTEDATSGMSDEELAESLLAGQL